MRDSASYIVTLIFDPSFGDRLAELPSGAPVWIVESLVNCAAVQRAWATQPSSAHLDGVTIFRGEENDAVASCKGILSEIELHHGTNSRQPPYSGIEVIGVELTSELKEALAEYGLARFTPRVDGFLAINSHPMPSVLP